MVSKLKLMIPLTLALSLSFNSHVIGDSYKEELSTTNNSETMYATETESDLEFVELYKMATIAQELEAIQEEAKRKEEQEKQAEENKRKEELREKQLAEQKSKEAHVHTASVAETKAKANTVKATNGAGRVLTVNASAYIAFCDTGCTGITATGVDVRSTIYYQGLRIIAVDPNVIPLYSIVEIEGSDERFISLDTGGAIKGNKIDILVGSTSEAIAFGRKNINIKVIREGK